MQELLRHSSLPSTLDVYTQAITPAQETAQAAVMRLSFFQGGIGKRKHRSEGLETSNPLYKGQLDLSTEGHSCVALLHPD